MSSAKLKLLYICLFLIFTQGLWERALPLPFFSYLIDFMVILFIFAKFRFKKAPGFSLFFVFIGVSIFVGTVNGSNIADDFLYTRYVIYFYLIFSQVWYLEMNWLQWRKLFKFIVFLVLIQGLGSIYTLIVIGDRIEGYVGLMSSLGGTTATIFPLFISSIIIILYLFMNRTNKLTILIMLSCLASVLLIGYASGKRTFYFIIPLFLVISLIISTRSLIRTSFYKKKLLGIALISLLIFPLLIFGISNSKGFSYSLSGNESSFGVISSALEYAQTYESSTDQYNQTIGRSNTTEKIVEGSLGDPEIFFLGKGYSSSKDENTMFQLGYGYGIVGFTRDLVSGGWFLVVVTFFLISKMILTNRSARSNFGTAMRKMLFLVFIYTHFFYSADYTVHLKITFLLAIISAFMNSPFHAKSFEALHISLNLKKQ